jgi:NADH-quinone oxidoreductase subunit K
MLLTQFVITFLIFTIGSVGLLIHRNNILIILMCIELLLLGVNINFILFSLYLDDVTGQI